MKKVWFLAIAVLCILGSTAFFYHSTLTAQPDPQRNQANIKWMSFEEAVAAIEKDKKAGRKPKKIFIDIYTDWCGWCKKMDKETFENAAIYPYLTKNFYPVKLDAEQRDDIKFSGHTFKFVAQGSRGYHELAASLLDGQMSYPTVIFLNEDIQLLQRIPGYLDIPTFDAIMHYLAEDHFKNTPWNDFQTKFNQQKNKK
jgi:thioredoxin-related protein